MNTCTFEGSYLHIYFKIGLVVQEEKIFLFCKCLFVNLLLSPIVKMCGLSIWTNWNPLHPGMLFSKFAWNWPSGSIKEDFEIFVISLLSPLGKMCCPSFKLTYIPFTHGRFVLSLVEICPLALEKTIFFNIVIICYFRIFSSWKG